MQPIALPEDTEKRFLKLEKIIEKNAEAFVQVGWALSVIRDEKLYKNCFRTFDEYCRERWGYARAHAYRLMESAKTVRMIERMSPNGDKIPTSEGQTRPLSSLPEEERPEAWNEAVRRSGAKVTASVVQEVVDERTASDGEEEEFEEALTEPNTTYILEDLKALWARANETDRQAFLTWIGGSHGKNN